MFGSVPATLQRFPASSFAGNQNLCGGPLSPCSPSSPSPSPPAAVPPEKPHHERKRQPTEAIIAVAAALGVALLALLVLCCWQNNDSTGIAANGGGAAAADKAVESVLTSSNSISNEAAGTGGADVAGERNRLVFVGRGGGYSFDLEDLLRASAEVLGKGGVGTSYRAVLEEGTTVVVKRLKDVTATRREFEQHMATLGGTEAQTCSNLLPVRAYY